MTRALTQQARVRTNTTQGSVCNIQVEAVTFAKLWAAYPGGHPYVDPRTGKPPPGYDNQCAINISVAIHGVGVEMKSFKGALVIVNGYRAASVASQLAAWLKLQPFCGLPPAPENVTGLDWQHKIRGRTGIVYFEDYWARNEKEKSTHKPTGDHVDLWNGSRMTAAGAHFFSAWGRRLGFPAIGAGTDWGYSDVGQSKLILFWEVK